MNDIVYYLHNICTIFGQCKTIFIGIQGQDREKGIGIKGIGMKGKELKGYGYIVARKI